MVDYVGRRKSSLAADFNLSKHRRMSFGFGVVPGVKQEEKGSQKDIDYRRPQLIYLNTYELDPHPDKVFNEWRVKLTTNDILEKLWTGHVYNASDSPGLALQIASKLTIKVKLMGFKRYRIISVVTIGQKRAQSYNNAITFLWDHERDNYVDVYMENMTNFIQVTVFGIYLD